LLLCGTMPRLLLLCAIPPLSRRAAACILVILSVRAHLRAIFVISRTKFQHPTCVTTGMINRLGYASDVVLRATVMMKQCIRIVPSQAHTAIQVLTTSIHLTIRVWVKRSGVPSAYRGTTGNIATFRLSQVNHAEVSRAVGPPPCTHAPHCMGPKKPHAGNRMADYGFIRRRRTRDAVIL
jgi:hypothetical protein